jgi:flagella basal body P-ring formation protein FlgA
MKKCNLIILILTLGLSVTVNAEKAFQSHEAIYKAVKEYIDQHIAFEDYETSITLLDSQLKLPDCLETLELFTTNDVIKPGRNSIGVRCNATDKWSIFTSVAIKTYQSVLVLLQPLQRGETITPQHLSLERRDVSSLRGDFISNIEQIQNKQAIRPMQSGTVLSMRNITEPKLVKRGDKITISSVVPDFAIRMNGLAMMDGVKGQSIKIKNQSSGRIINATVIEPGLVSVNH